MRWRKWILAAAGAAMLGGCAIYPYDYGYYDNHRTNGYYDRYGYYHQPRSYSDNYGHGYYSDPRRGEWGG